MAAPLLRAADIKSDLDDTLDTKEIDLGIGVLSAEAIKVWKNFCYFAAMSYFYSYLSEVGLRCSMHYHCYESQNGFEAIF